MIKPKTASLSPRACRLLLKFAHQHKNRTAKEARCKECWYDDSEEGMTLHYCKNHWEWRSAGIYLRDAALYRARCPEKEAA